MYDTETVERLLPGVCWNHHLAQTFTERGRKNHVCTRNEAFWASPPAAKPKKSVDPANYRRSSWPSREDLAQMDEKAADIWRARIEKCVDPAKRKSATNPKLSNRVWAELIDVQRGWDGVELTLAERRSVLLAHGLQWTHEEIAFNQGVTRRAISYRIANAINKITAYLNGGVIEELEPEE